MSLLAGLAEIDITPPVGTHKIGWLKVIASTEVRDPLFARAVVLRNATGQIGLVQLDTLFVAWPEVAAIRGEIARQFGFPGGHVMVAATHNHAGPAVTHAGDVPKDLEYAQTLVSKAVQAFGQALQALREVEIGVGRCFEWRVAHNRRVVMRDGTVRTHGTFDDPEALCLEGPVDPEVAVVVLRSLEGEVLGSIVDFACHPTHHGGDGVLSAGFPGALADELRAQSRGHLALFLNGASGNLHTSDPCAGGRGPAQEEVGRMLAEDVRQATRSAVFASDLSLGAASRVVELPYRQVTQDEVRGTARGAQRFIDAAIYDRTIPPLVDKIRQRGTHLAEIQALFLGDVALIGVPGEYFCEFGLRIKQEVYPTRALVVTCANGRVGYIPTRDAFRRGGYETTFGPSSMLAPEAGDLIAETAVDLVRRRV